MFSIAHCYHILLNQGSPVKFFVKRPGHVLWALAPHITPVTLGTIANMTIIIYFIFYCNELVIV